MPVTRQNTIDGSRLCCALAALAMVIILTAASSSAYAQGSTTRYVYDDNGRLRAVIAPNGEANIYEYDAAGNITAIRRNTASTLEVLGFTPSEGLVGTQVTIFGTGFGGGVTGVLFNGAAAQIVSVNAPVVIATVPSNAMTGPITVTTPTGSAASGKPFVVLFPPIITSFTPAIGPAGTVVNITGDHFENTSAANQVAFNITPAEVGSATTTMIATSVPAGATSGRISVTTSIGTGVSSGDFIVPPSGYTAGDIEVATRMAIGETKTVTISTTNKIALVLFDSTAGQRIFLGISATLTGNFADVRILKPDGTLLAGTSIAVSGIIDTQTLPITGTYTILVDPNGSTTGSVTLTLYDVPPDVTGAITIGGPPVTVTITARGQNARMTFSGATGQRIFLGISATLTGNFADVRILKPDGTLLAGTFIAVSGIIDTQTLPITGTYTILVDPNGSTTGSVTLTLYDVPPDATGTITIGGPPVTVTTTVPGQNGRLTFSGTSGQRISLGISATLTGNFVEVRILKPDGTSEVNP